VALQAKNRQCVNFSVKSQISKSYWVENFISADQFSPWYAKI